MAHCGHRSGAQWNIVAASCAGSTFRADERAITWREQHVSVGFLHADSASRKIRHESGYRGQPQFKYCFEQQRRTLVLLKKVQRVQREAQMLLRRLQLRRKDRAKLAYVGRQRQLENIAVQPKEKIDAVGGIQREFSVTIEKKPLKIIMPVL